MKNSFKKIAAASALFAMTSIASATTVFTVDNSQGVADTMGTSSIFNADGLSGSYNEVVRPDGTGGFAATIVLRYNDFLAVPGSSLDGSITGLNNEYSIYSVINITGDVVNSNLPVSITTGNWAGSYNMMLDVGLDTKADLASAITGIGSVDFTAGGGVITDDVELLSGSIAIGSSQGNQEFVIPMGPPTGDITVPSSGSYTLASGDVTTTAAGDAFFVAPNPFYENLLSFGSLRDFFEQVDFTLDEDQLFNGTADVTFAPEPSGIVLLGLGVVGLAFASRKKLS